LQLGAYVVGYWHLRHAFVNPVKMVGRAVERLIPIIIVVLLAAVVAYLVKILVT
jgi:hypothetical protein